MLLVLHGAKRNVGDFLIRDRAVRLLEHLLPDQELRLHPRWRPISRDDAEHADGIVLAGGPGLAKKFHPTVFPLVDDVRSLATPVLPLGWSGRPKGHPEQFRFDTSSLAAIQSIHERIGWSSVRDLDSEFVLRGAGIDNVRMTGCVAWYELRAPARPDPPDSIGHLVLTTPASRRTNSLSRSRIRLMQSLSDRFPDAARTCAFHRGTGHGPHSNRASAIGHQALAAAARRAGYEVVDVSGDAAHIEFYREADLHVGYRVHAHLAFLSAHRPSILLEEDGRGSGQARTLHPQMRLGVGRGAVREAIDAVDRELADGFPALRSSLQQMSETFPVMRETILQLA